MCSLVFAKLVQRRHGPKGTSGLLLRKEGWRASCFCYPQSGVPEPSKHNTPPSSPATLAWPLPFGIPPLLSAQALLPAHFSTLFLPYSLGEAQASVHWDVARQSLPWWLRGGVHNPQLLIINLWRQTGSWRQWVE